MGVGGKEISPTSAMQSLHAAFKVHLSVPRIRGAGGVQQPKASGKECVKTWRWDRFLLWLARDLWLQWRLRMRIMPVGTNCILIYYLADQEPDMAYSKSRVGAGVIGRALASCCKLFGAKRSVQAPPAVRACPWPTLRRNANPPSCLNSCWHGGLRGKSESRRSQPTCD